MRVYKNELELLKKAQSAVGSKFQRLGVNKKGEIARLIYEISKKESIPPEAIVQGIDSKKFNGIKQYLLKRRYPFSYLHNELSKVYLPKFNLDPLAHVNLGKTRFYPKRVFIEKLAQSLYLADRFKKSFPEATFQEIKSLKEYLKKNRTFKIEDYNKRCDTVFITYENHDFFKGCPCTKKAVGCGYHIFNLGFGCMYECTYCYLQEYTNIPGLIFPANIDSFFRVFSSYKRPGTRIGTGEFSDSLMLDHITEYSLPILDFFKKHQDVVFEFKTKSKNINNLLKTGHSGNIVVAWSLNPQRIIDENEFLTPSLNERISSARRCSEAGYRLGFHFDPLVYFKGWEKEYAKVTDLLFSAIKPKYIAWISIGTLRFNPKVKKLIEVRFPGNKILDEELVPGFDNKLRYPYSIRYDMYQCMLKMLLKYSKKLPIYLCMEEISIWKNLAPTLPSPLWGED